jgi:2'-5' RNA ligase
VIENAPIIVSAVFGAADFRWVDGLRRAHFPPERNHLSAHLTLFHHLPPSALPELLTALSRACAGPPPPATITGLMNLGRGVAFRVSSPGLEAIRADLAEAFHGLLTPQDEAGWRPHVTIQNKVEPHVARALLAQLSEGFRQRPLVIRGLTAWYYRGGPWEEIRTLSFRGG